MADAGAMLAQLWGNNPLDAYVKGAQIKATLDGIAANVAATTFQNNLETVKLAQQQSEDQFTNRLKTAELQNHSTNAETERMFALQKLDPTSKSLAIALQQAKIDSYKNKNPLYSPPPAGPYGGTEGVNSSQIPKDDSGLPMATTDAGGNPGVLPALPQNQSVNPITAGPPPTATQGNVPIPADQAQQLQAQGLQMAQQHQEQYGQSYQDSLNPDNDPSPSELESAQGVQQFSDLLAQSQPRQTGGIPVAGGQREASAAAMAMDNANPLFKAPPAGGIPAPAQSAPPPVAPKSGATNAPPAAPPAQQQVVRPTDGPISRGDGTAYSIRQDSDGTLSKQDFKWNEEKKAFIPDGRPLPVKSAAPQSVPPKMIDGAVRASFSLDPKGGYNARYVDPKTGAETTVSYVYNPDGTVFGKQVIADGKVKQVLPEKSAKNLRNTTPAMDKELDKLYVQTKIDPDNAATKAEIFKAAYNRDPKTEKEWATAYDLAVKQKTALEHKITDLQKGNYIVPSQYLSIFGSSAAPAAQPSPAASKLPSALQQFAPNGK